MDPELCSEEFLEVESESNLAKFRIHSSMNRTIARYRSEVGLPQSIDQHSRPMEFWRTEIEELKRSVDILEARLSHSAGEDLSSLGMKELRQLERQTRTAVERRRIISENINLMKRKLHELHDTNVSSKISGQTASSCNISNPRVLQDGVVR
ncbi:agamous-like mads-box protein agl8 like protein [Quercus suber]|uniref:Agamous-like mads-box protein agl8 like protein n=1 Tax=Quercus suber TaxID=58331 RepID=A0AAW0KJ99_QUESU